MLLFGYCNHSSYVRSDFKNDTILFTCLKNLLEQLAEQSWVTPFSIQCDLLYC